MTGRTGTFICSSHSKKVASIWLFSALCFYILFQMALRNSSNTLPSPSSGNSFLFFLSIFNPCFVSSFKCVCFKVSLVWIFIRINVSFLIYLLFLCFINKLILSFFNFLFLNFFKQIAVFRAIKHWHRHGHYSSSRHQW